MNYADLVVTGLHVRVGSSGKKSFSVVFRFAGRQRRHTLGPYPRWSLAQARAEAVNILQQVDKGIDPRPSALDVPVLTLGEAMGEYTRLHLQPNVRSWRNVLGSLNNPALRALHTRPIASLSRRDVITAIDLVLATGRGHAAVNVLRHLRAMLNWAVDRDLLPTNPCDRIRPAVRTTERDRVLNDCEIAAVWHAIEQLPPPYRQMWQLFVLTGQRRTEVGTMRWEDITGDMWVIPRERVKKDRAHAVPLTPMALAVLATLPGRAATGYVFSTDGRRPSSNFTKVKLALDQASGVRGWVIHDLRRTVRSKLAELGVPLEIARKVTNHEEGKIDRVYNRYAYQAEKRAALQQWADHLEALTSQAAA